MVQGWETGRVAAAKGASTRFHASTVQTMSLRFGCR